MRLWSLHPCYLDAKGLVALWREALLAQSVLNGQTKGYRNHPQLERFKRADVPALAVASYLSAVADEADRRGYRFDRRKIVGGGGHSRIAVTSGQIDYERDHLLAKLRLRDPERHQALGRVKRIDPHPLFFRVDGGVESWEVLG